MKARVVLIVSALLAAASVAAAEPPREKALMLYFSKSFGGTGNRAPAPLAFGLRLQQSSPFDGRSFALVDARYSFGGTHTLGFGGIPLLSLGEEDGADADSSGDSSGAFRGFAREHPGWTAAAIVGALLGGACLAAWGICEDSEDEAEGEPTYTPTGS
ncbi:MAG: hypothetical protein ABI821_13925 [Pseudomonadota bacterium]